MNTIILFLLDALTTQLTTESREYVETVEAAIWCIGLGILFVRAVGELEETEKRNDCMDI